HSSLLSAPHGPPPALHSFPTRRSSDLLLVVEGRAGAAARGDRHGRRAGRLDGEKPQGHLVVVAGEGRPHRPAVDRVCADPAWSRSEEHTSELQSRENLVCRLLLEKKNK